MTKDVHTRIPRKVMHFSLRLIAALNEYLYVLYQFTSLYFTSLCTLRDKTDISKTLHDAI